MPTGMLTDDELLLPPWNDPARVAAINTSREQAAGLIASAMASPQTSPVIHMLNPDGTIFALFEATDIARVAFAKLATPACKALFLRPLAGIAIPERGVNIAAFEAHVRVQAFITIYTAVVCGLRRYKNGVAATESFSTVEYLPVERQLQDLVFHHKQRSARGFQDSARLITRLDRLCSLIGREIK